MAARSAVGGGNLVEFYPLATDNTLGTLEDHTENKTVSTKITGHPIRKKMVIDLDARHGDMDFEDFLTAHMYDGEVTAIEQKYEDSTMDTATVVPHNGDYYLGYVLYFGANGSDRKVLYGVGVISGNTGDITTGEAAFEQSTVQLTAVAAPATIEFATSVFNTSKVATPTAALSLASGSYGVYTKLTAAS